MGRRSLRDYTGRVIAPGTSQVQSDESAKKSRCRLRVILYHHLADKPCHFVDQLGISTSPDTFSSHLKWLSKRYDFVDLDTVLNGNLPRRPLLITFDDGYRSVLDLAAPILRDHSAPSVFFISEKIIGGGDLPLDNLLCCLANDVGLPKVETALTGHPPVCASLPELFERHISGLSFAERMALPERLAAEFNLDLRALRAQSSLFLRGDEIRALAEARIEVGNHTRSHLHCRCLDDETSNAEIVEHRATLERLAGRPVRSFSFPYGSSADATAVVDRALRASRHEAIFLVEARLNPPGHAGPYWHRISMQNQPVSALRKRIEILPRLRAVRDRLQGARPMHESRHTEAAGNGTR